MALKETGSSVFKKSKDVAVGERITGYVVGFHNGGMYPAINCLKMKDKQTGSNFVLTPHGTLKYFKENNHKPGFYYEFMRLEDKTNKRGQIICQFKVFVDTDDTCEIEGDTVEPTVAS